MWIGPGDQPTKRTVSSLGPWAPSTRIRSMSLVRLGSQVIKAESCARGIRCQLSADQIEARSRQIAEQLFLARQDDMMAATTTMPTSALRLRHQHKAARLRRSTRRISRDGFHRQSLRAPRDQQVNSVRQIGRASAWHAGMVNAPAWEAIFFHPFRSRISFSRAASSAGSATQWKSALRSAALARKRAS